MKNFLLITALLLSLSAVKAQKQDSLKSKHLQEIVVHASRSQSKLGDIPGKVDVLLKKDIQQTPSDNITELLKKTSGVDVISYPGILSSIGMRGFTPSTSNEYNVLLIDNIPAGTENIGSLDVNYLQQVEVLKGPYSSLYGTNAMGGIISMVTKKSTGALSGSLSGGFGSFNTFNFFGGIGGSITPKLSFDLGIGGTSQNGDYKTGSNNLLSQSEKEKSIIDPNTVGKEYLNTTYQKFNGNFRLGYQLNKDIVLNYYLRNFTANNILTNGTFYGVYGSSKKDIKRWSQGLNIAINKTHHTFSISPYFSNEVTEYYNTDEPTKEFIDTEKTYKEYGVMSTGKWLLGANNITYGIDWNNKRYESKYWSAINERTSPYQPDYVNGNLGLFVESNLAVWQNKLQISAGLRFDNNYFQLFSTPELETEALSESHQILSPHISLQYRLNSDWRITSSFGTGFHTPDAFQKAGSYKRGTRAYKGNADLKPEQSQSYDIGIAYSSWKTGWQGSLTFFNTNHSDFIEYDYSNPEYTSFKNTNKAHMNGLEAELSYDFGVKQDWSLLVFSNMTYLLTSESEDNGVKADLLYVRKENINFGIEYDDNKHWATRLSGRYAGKRFENNWISTYSNGAKVPYTTADGQEVRPSLIDDAILEHPAALLFDWTASYSFDKKYIIKLTASNLLDEIYTEKDAYPLPGRAISVTFTWKF